MVNSCIVIGCANRQTKGVNLSFSRLPKDAERRRLWLAAINRKNYNPPLESDVRVCGIHFINGVASIDRCSPDYVPTLHLGYEVKTSTSSSSSQARYERGLKRELTKSVEEQERAKPFLESSCEESFKIIESITKDDDESLLGEASHADCSRKQGRLEEDVQRLKSELQCLRTERDELREQLKSSKFCFDFVDTDEKAQFFTGLPSLACLLWFFDFVSCVLPSSSVLAPKDVILLIFMKLRLNLLNQDLAYRFGISKGTVSNILNSGLPSIAKKVSGFIHWPDKPDVLRTLPKVFKKSYPRCKVIIDCTEIYIDRPGNLEARQLTWSNYKHNNTLKVLIGISPTGGIIFLSRAYGGRVSDKVITQRSGFLDMLEFGDQVLADRGFLVADDIASCNASLIIPSFTKGKSQLSQEEVEISRRIARVRIHVERAIGRIKNFRIVSTPMQLNMVPNFDNIMTICSAITNLHPKLVK